MALPLYTYIRNKTDAGDAPGSDSCATGGEGAWRASLGRTGWKACATGFRADRRGRRSSLSICQSPADRRGRLSYTPICHSRADRLCS
jgi:hypothetical protein